MRILSAPLTAKDAPKLVVPTLFISSSDYDLMLIYAQTASPQEVNGYGLIDQGARDQFILCPGGLFITDQVVTQVSAKPTAVGNAYAGNRADEAGKTLGLQWHSHGRGSAYHSSTDLGTAHTYGNVGTIDWMIWVVINDRGDVVARLEQYAPIRIGVPMTVIVVPDNHQQLLEQVTDDIARHVRVETPPIPSKALAATPAFVSPDKKENTK